MQLAAWEFWAAVSLLPIVLFPQICYVSQSGLSRNLCNVSESVTIIIGFKKAIDSINKKNLLIVTVSFYLFTVDRLHRSMSFTEMDKPCTVNRL